MLLFIEGYSYTIDVPVRKDGHTIRDILADLVPPLTEEGAKVPFEYVGYYYSRVAGDMVFFLPKVVLLDTENTVFGAKPEDIIDFDAIARKEKAGNVIFAEEELKDYKKFLSELSIWVYRAISVYQENYDDNDIIQRKELHTDGGNRKRKHNTLLDVIIAMREFNRKNQDFLTFIAKQAHSGYNKISWSKTISRSQAIIQDGVPIYMNPVNKKKEVNYDEELLIIFYSILNYVHEEHGFDTDININYPLIPASKIKHSYIEKGLGKRRLRQIKYKYFSDKTLHIWDLCYAFFERSHEIAINQVRIECMLVHKFEHVFEAMIDDLIGDDINAFGRGVKKQQDGKRIDHIYLDKNLIEQDENAWKTYYISDSKYYKRNEQSEVSLGETSIYKQFTYARNVVQWSMNIFLGINSEQKGYTQVRDSLTEGYNPIPNFFISGHIPAKKDAGEKYLSFTDPALKQQDSLYLNRHFENRLFDRDTLLLSHYDVNFLFVIALYGRDNKSKKEDWKQAVRHEFREKVQQTLNKMYEFRKLQPVEGSNWQEYIRQNFQALNGKIYRPYDNCPYLVMALMRNDAEAQKLLEKMQITKHEEIAQENHIALDAISEYFNYSKPVTIEQIETAEMEDYPASLVRINPDAKVLVVVDIDNTQWDKFDNMDCIYIGMETVNKAFEYYHEFADADYILLTHRDERTYLFKTHGKPTMQNEKPQNGLGRSFKKPSEGELLMWPDMLYMSFAISKEDKVDLHIDKKRIDETAPQLGSGSHDYYSPRMVKFSDIK